MLKIRNAIVLISLVSMTLPIQAFDLKNIVSEAEKKASDLFEGISPKAANNPLTTLLSKDLGVNDKQASGGAGAMLAMAYQELDKEQSDELLNLIPNMKTLTNMIPDKLGSNLKNISDVNRVFKHLGLDPSMVKKFAPMLLTYLSGKGASEPLIRDLSRLWAK